MLRLGGEDGANPFPHILNLSARGADSPDADKQPPLRVPDVQCYPALILPLAPTVPMLFPTRHRTLLQVMVYH